MNLKEHHQIDTSAVEFLLDVQTSGGGAALWAGSWTCLGVEALGYMSDIGAKFPKLPQKLEQQNFLK